MHLKFKDLISFAFILLLVWPITNNNTTVLDGFEAKKALFTLSIVARFLQ